VTSPGAGAGSVGEWVRVGPDRTAYDGYLRVVRRRVRLPDGREAIWDLLDTPATVAVLPLTPDGRVVCVRQYRVGPQRIVLGIPGGLVDEGEDAAAAAARELREETGYVAGSVEVVASTTPNHATHRRWVAVARDCVPTGVQELDDLEECEPVVVTLAQLRTELRAGRLSGTEQTYLALDHLGLL
jgi:ADP-ribose pyrophosphatase